jgi:hypothetical protein
MIPPPGGDRVTIRADVSWVGWFEGVNPFKASGEVPCFQSFEAGKAGLRPLKTTLFRDKYGPGFSGKIRAYH